MEKQMFRDLEKIGYRQYLQDNPFHVDLGIELDKYLKSGRIETKKEFNQFESVDKFNAEQFSAELDDLIRLHFLVTTRKVTTILEFGVGFSTKVLDHALSTNKNKFHNHVSTNLRRSNPFELHSVDNYRKWIRKVKKNFRLDQTHFHYSKCVTTTFNDRICTVYKRMPNICPDFIYVDGPDQFSPTGNVRGISTRHIDRLPMSADLLAIEHFLLPGTLIAIDGRSANARFLKTNFQRNWTYQYFNDFDQHFFELNEPPLGIWNERQINFATKG
jgi:hypothetical protein